MQGPRSKSSFLHVESSLDLQHQCHVCLGKGLVELLVKAALVQRAFRQSFFANTAHKCSLFGTAFHVCFGGFAPHHLRRSQELADGMIHHEPAKLRCDLAKRCHSPSEPNLKLWFGSKRLELRQSSEKQQAAHECCCTCWMIISKASCGKNSRRFLTAVALEPRS